MSSPENIVVFNLKGRENCGPSRLINLLNICWSPGMKPGSDGLTFGISQNVLEDSCDVVIRRSFLRTHLYVVKEP
jgi:hypothetical protein